ncbi:MAG: flagellar hook-associated protein FlgK [Hungatella sp.]|nr:flagellar hook-associated protein FlgK [Hungatella sp.]
MTRSTFSGFTIAHLAMNASMRALDVTGQNIANINTKGYTRQQLDLVSLNFKGGDFVSGGPGSKIGYGVEITGISQIRDPFLDVQYRNQIAKVGTADARQGTLDQLADIFDETNKDGLKKALSDLSSSLDQLSSKANNAEFDSIVRSRCQVLLNYIHQKSDELQSVREETISGLEKTDIPALNGLLSDIGELNDAIWKSQVLGNPSLELQDQRNLKLDELASYIPISVSYKEVSIADGLRLSYPVVKFTGSDGMTYNLTAGEHGENSASFSADRNKGIDGNYNGTVSISLIPASDFPSNTDVTPLKTDITSYLKEGTLKGLVDILNKSGELDSPPTDYRGLGYYERSFDAFVQSFAQTFNKLNTNTVPYTGVSSFPSNGTVKEMMTSGTEKAEYTVSFLNSSGNFLNKEKISINGQTYTFGDGTGGTIEIGSDLETSLINLAAYMTANAPDVAVNGTNTAGSWTYDPSTAKLSWTSNLPMATGTDITADSINLTFAYKADPFNIKNFDLFKTSDGSRTFTADNIKISDDWMNNSVHIISSHDENAGSTANDNIIKMLKSLSDERDFKYEYTYLDQTGKPQTGYINFYNGNYLQCYSNLENIQGIDSSANKAILTNHISVLQQTSNSRDSVSGVSLDEEGINLMQYQRSYTAAARLMTTLDEALDVLINNTGIVGR